MKPIDRIINPINAMSWIKGHCVFLRFKDLVKKKISE